METIDIANILRNINGFDDRPKDVIERQHDDLWHWFKHCFGFLGDVPHMLTVEEYIQFGREIGRLAADGAPGTYIKVRAPQARDGSLARPDDILIYWEGYGNMRGIFMVVQPQGPLSGLITTLFSPEDGKRYFDLQEPVAPTFH